MHSLAYNLRVIEFSGAGLESGGSTLLSDFSWQMPDPGIYLLLGGNGSGKSLLSSVLCGRTRLNRGSVSLMGEPASKMAGQVWYADAAVAIRDDESVEEYIEYELSASGAAGSSVDDCLRLLDQHHKRIGDRLLSQLPHHELLLVQIAIASFVEGPLRILDGHLTFLDDHSCKLVSQMLQGFAVRQEEFLLLTASRIAADLPDLRESWLLSREKPLTIRALDSLEGISTGMQLLSSSTAINVYFRNIELSPRDLTSGDNYRVLNRLEGGLNVELTGSLEECLSELSAKGIDVRRIDLPRP